MGSFQLKRSQSLYLAGLFSLFMTASSFGERNLAFPEQEEVETASFAIETEMPRTRKDLMHVAFLVENDGAFKIPNTDDDRHYTHGAMIVVGGTSEALDKLASPIMPLPHFFERHFGLANYGGGFLLGQRIHTPTNTATFLPVPGDIPYSGHLFMGGFMQRSNEAGTIMDHIQLEVGAFGPASGGEIFQEGWHDLFGFKEINGWGNQTRNEPTIQMYYRVKLRQELPVPNFLEGYLEWDAISHMEIALGTVERHLASGGLLRIGYGLTEDFGPMRMADLNYFGPKTRRPFSAYFYGGVTSRLVQWNLYLQGNQIASYPYGVSPLNINGQFQAGLVLAYQWGNQSLEASYYYTWLTRQFKGQGDSDSFAGLQFAWTWWE